jgi:Tol biopolymer transport system component
MRNVILTATALLAAATAVSAQSLPPALAWRTFQTDGLRVTFAPGLESLARHAADVAATAWPLLAAQVADPPAGTIDIVLSDHVDFSNGYAQTHPSNRIVVYARPPVSEPELNWFNDWVGLVVVHELAHIFHLDATGRLGSAIRSIFGRVPMTWPAFPVRGTPAWSTEGLAVGLESAFTGWGRIHGSFHDMVVRTAVLEDAFDPFERVSSTSPIWPGDQRVYIFGSLFLHHLEQTHGAGTNREIVARTADAFLPPALFFSNVGRRAIGSDLGTAYAAWRDTLEIEYDRTAASLKAAGLTSGTRITRHGRIAQYPRAAPDGWRVAYSAADGREDSAIRIVDAFQGNRLSSIRRNGTGALAWLPDGSGLLYSQPEFAGPYHAFQDLWITDAGGERRITHEARLQDPDIASSGRIVAIRNGGGTTWPVLVDTATGDIRDLVAPAPDQHWSDVRWSPGGTRIAAANWRDGEWSIVVLDTLGSLVRRITDEGAAATPAWSPDGQYLIWSSDRTGISNLYGVPLSAADPGARQITNVLTGAFTPDVSSDGRTLWYSIYSSDGYHLERTAFDPSTWRDPSPATRRPHADPADDVQTDAAAPNDARVNRTAGLNTSSVQAVARRWSPLPTLRPWYWAPVLTDRSGAGTFLGASSSGQDVIGRHAWAARLAFDPGSGVWEGGAVWRNARFGVPIIELAAYRQWDDLGQASIPDTDETRTVVERQDVLAAFAIFPVRRWRSSVQFAAGTEYERDRRLLLRSPAGIRLRDPRDELVSMIARVGFANYRTHAFSISREDGVSIGVAGRIARERDAMEDFPRNYEEITTALAAYRALPLDGFARPVVAARFAALQRTGEGAEPSSIGGISGTPYDIFGVTFSQGSLLLPLRGVERGQRTGTRAWTASAELRVPIAIPGRRPPWSPFYFDRISASVFSDFGDASCSAAQAGVYASCARANAAAGILATVGAELVTDLGIGSWFYSRVRFGVGQPLSGPDRTPAAWIRFGSAF